MELLLTIILGILLNVIMFLCGFGLKEIIYLYRKYKIKPKVMEAYNMLRKVCEPETLNPEHLGNKSFMSSEARDLANLLINPLKKMYFATPQPCTKDEKCLKEWFDFLGMVRRKLN